MNDWLVEEVKKSEGFRGMPYVDTRGNPTIGYGTLLPINEDEAELLLRHRLQLAIDELKGRIPWIVYLQEDIQNVLYDMAYNMGVPRLMQFKNTLAAAERGDWQTMADEMVDSAWYRQVGSRAKRLVSIVRNYA